MSLLSSCCVFICNSDHVCAYLTAVSSRGTGAVCHGDAATFELIYQQLWQYVPFKQFLASFSFSIKLSLTQTEQTRCLSARRAGTRLHCLAAPMWLSTGERLQAANNTPPTTRQQRNTRQQQRTLRKFAEEALREIASTDSANAPLHISLLSALCAMGLRNIFCVLPYSVCFMIRQTDTICVWGDSQGITIISNLPLKLTNTIKFK